MQQDSLRAILDSVFAAPHYHWAERPRPWYAFLAGWLDDLNRWLLALRESHPFAFKLFLAALVVSFVGILVHVGWILVRTLRPEDSGLASTSGEPALGRDQAWYRREADRLAAEGRYVEAVQADFLALVLALDESKLLRFHPGKTPGEYAREAGLAPRAREEFRELVRFLYGYAFARWPCGPAEFERWRARTAPEHYAPAY